jgi:hypothetical protein
MSNRLIKTALLSLSAATLLTTSAFAEITTTISDKPDSFTKSAGIIDFLKVELGVTTVSKLESMTVQFADQNGSALELPYAVLETARLYHGGLDSSDIIKEIDLADTTITKAGTAVTFNVSDADILFKTGTVTYGTGELKTFPNTFYVSAKYGDFPSSDIVNDGSEVSARITGINVIETYYTDVEAKTVDANAFEESLVISSDNNITSTREIDRVAPKLQIDVADLAATVYEDHNNTNYNFSTYKVKYLFDETLNSAYANSITRIKDAFEIKDSAGNEISIDSHTYSEVDKNATDDGNSTIVLSLNRAELNASVGNINVTYDYSSELFRDDFGNAVVSVEKNVTAKDFPVSDEVFADGSNPEMYKLTLDFDDKSIGKLTFSESVVQSTISASNFVSDDKKVGIKAFTNFEDVADEDNGNSLRTVASFELNTTADTNLTLVYSEVNATATVANETVDFSNREMANGEDVNYTTSTIATDGNDFQIAIGEWRLVSLKDNTRTTSKRALKSGSVEMIWEYDTEKKWNRFPEHLVAGKGYWIKGSQLASKFGTVEIAVDDGKTLDVDDKANIMNSTHNKWELIGVSESDMALDTAYSQVADGCYGVTLFYYDNAGATGWNKTSNIPVNSGLWVRQDCLEYNEGDE